MEYPHNWIRYDLNVPATTDSVGSAVEVINKRTQVTVCERALTVAANCVVIGTGIKALANAMASAVKFMSNQNDCGKFEGVYQDVGYRYTSLGTHCDTTAEQNTIAGTIQNHLKNTDGGKVCGMECLNLSHEGTWNGFLLIGPRATFDVSVCCGPSLSFGQCDSGGKSDFN